MRSLLRSVQRKELALVLVLSGLMTYLTTIHFFLRLWRNPPGHQFIGVTHYYEDFFYYLDQFYQGAHGRWLIVNRFSTERFPPALLYLNHVLLGKLGGWLGWPSFVSYNVSNIILKFSFIVLSYLVLLVCFPKQRTLRFVSFFLFLGTTSLPQPYVTGDGLTFYQPVEVFRANIDLFSRFGNVPNTHLINIYFLLGFLAIGVFFSELLYRASIRFWLLLLGTLIMTLLAVSEPVKLLVLGMVYSWIALRHQKVIFAPTKRTAFLVASLILFLPAVLLTVFQARSLTQNAVYVYANTWDIEQYFKQATLLTTRHYLTTFGLFLFLFFCGIRLFWQRRWSVFEEMALSAVIFCLLGYTIPLVFQIPFPGFRFLFSDTYLLAAIFAGMGVLWLSHQWRYLPVWVIIAVYVMINATALFYTLPVLVQPLQEPDFHFTHLPDDIYEGFLYLQKNVPDGSYVLASSDTSMDLMIPGLTGKRTYSGHFLTTYNSQEKDRQSHQFFFEPMAATEARTFLQANRIMYVLQTKYSHSGGSHVHDYYPFLEVVFTRPGVRIYKVPQE